MHFGMTICITYY